VEWTTAAVELLIAGAALGFVTTQLNGELRRRRAHEQARRRSLGETRRLLETLKLQLESPEGEVSFEATALLANALANSSLMEPDKATAFAASLLNARRHNTVAVVVLQMDQLVERVDEKLRS